MNPKPKKQKRYALKGSSLEGGKPIFGKKAPAKPKNIGQKGYALLNVTGQAPSGGAGDFAPIGRNKV